jgi:hypothetical protein
MQGLIEPHLLDYVQKIPNTIKSMNAEIIELKSRNKNLILLTITLAISVCTITYHFKKQKNETQKRG